MCWLTWPSQQNPVLTNRPYCRDLAAQGLFEVSVVDALKEVTWKYGGEKSKRRKLILKKSFRRSPSYLIRKLPSQFRIYWAPSVDYPARPQSVPKHVFRNLPGSRFNFPLGQPQVNTID